MSLLEVAHGTLLQEGYRPGAIQGETLNFRYYGQRAQLRVRPLGPGAALGEVECRLPRPAPSRDQMLAFSAAHPLSRLGAQEDQAALLLSTMLTEGDAGRQVQALLALLDQYVAAAVFAPSYGAALTAPEAAARPPVSSEVETPGAALPDVTAPPQDHAAQPTQEPVTPALDDRTAAPASAEPGAPHGWQDLWDLMNPRFHPLAQALAALGVPAPDDVHVDMVQGHQVRGAALMMWGQPPGAVVVCEPGQPVPSGYQGSTWYKHLTVERVAQETRAHLQAAGRL